MMIRLLATLWLLALAGTVHAEAKAGEVVRWTDENGVAQFTDPKFAPTAEVVEIKPANGMDVPSAPKTSSSGKPNFVKISKPAKNNKRGFRGHGRRAKNSRHYR